MRTIRTVLAVDDDERLLVSLARTFRHETKVLLTTDPATATELARREHPDLAIVDMRLGTASGIDLVREIKAEAPDVTVALVSAYLSIDSTVIAVRAGADLVMLKPFTAKDILRRLEEGEPTDPDLEETPTLARVESEHIARVMADCHGNVSEAARRLGIYRSSLQRRLRRRE